MLLGPDYQASGETQFCLWAPSRKQVTIHIIFPHEKKIKMKRDKKEDYWSLNVKGVYPGYQYYYQLDSNEEFPDPVSQYQPKGVHGPSQVVDHSFFWDDQNWRGIPLPEMVIYELHVGTFTREGDFNAIIPRLDELVDIGINTIELMPVGSFPESETGVMMESILLRCKIPMAHRIA